MSDLSPKIDLKRTLLGPTHLSRFNEREAQFCSNNRNKVKPSHDAARHTVLEKRATLKR
jgi:hypothetical protein